MANQSKHADLEGSLARKPSRSIGRIANDLLTRGCSGKVLAVVSNAAYLQTNDGEIFWLARDNVPMHARGVICDYDENALHVGMSFVAGDAVLQIASTTIDTHNARVWQPRAIAPFDVASREVMSERARVIARRRSLPTKQHLHLRAVQVSPNRKVEIASSHTTLLAMTMACRELIGLGAGLTPAGDDFVGGMLFAAHHLREAYTLTWDTQPFEDLIDWARTRTNIISYTILRDLANGQGPEPLHDLMFALLARDAAEDAVECATRLTRIGSSTGTEMLAGALTGIKLIEDKGSWE